MIGKHLAVILCLLLAFGPPAAARTRKGDKLFKQGESAETRKDWTKALELYDQALDTDPRDPAYMMAVRRVRFQAGQQRVDHAQKLRAEGKLEEALAEFQSAILIDPASAIAIAEAKRTLEMIQGAPKDAAKPEDRGLTPAERIRRESEDRMSRVLSPPELKPIIRQPNNLTMNNQPVRVLYETVAKLAGINVIFDSQFTSTSRNFNINLANATLEEALDYLAIVTKTYWKPISTNAIFVTEDNVTKRRDYEDNVVKVFYVTNATSVQEFQEIATAIRSLTDIRRVFTYNAHKAMVVRGTVDQVALAEKLVRDLDKPKAEVVVDVIVMEANSSRARDWALSIMSAGAAGLSIPVGFTPRNPILTGNNGGNNGDNNNGDGNDGGGSTQGQAISLARIGRISTNDFSTTLPGALLNAVLTDRSTRVLQNPQVRSSDGQKVSLKIGDRIPYVTGSLAGLGTAGVGGLPYAQSQFNYADVGVNVDITPQVHGDSEVTLHIEVEVSNVRDRVEIGGLEQPVIGQRKSIADLRLREGEINILGGLSQAQDTRTLSGIPGLIEIPALGRWLGQNSKQVERGELMIALIPHIVRTPGYTADNLRGIYAGVDQTVKVNIAPKAEPEPAKPAAAKPVLPKLEATKPDTPKPETPKPDVPKPDVPKPAPSGPVKLGFTPTAIDTRAGGIVAVTIQVQDVQDLFQVQPLKIKWDSSLLRLNDVAPGDLFVRDGQRPTSVKDIRNDIGEATLTVARLPGAPGVTGSGILATLTFLATGRGSGTVQVQEIVLRNTQLQQIPAGAAELPVKIQ